MPGEPAWKQLHRDQAEYMPIQHMMDIRQRQCLAREYLLRRPIMPIPKFLHKALFYQDWLVEDTLLKHHPQRKPVSDLAPSSAALPYLVSFVREGQHLCWKCRQIDFEAVFDGGAEIKDLTLPYNGVRLLSNVARCRLCRFLSQIAAQLSLDPVPVVDHGPGDWTLDVRKGELIIYHGGTRRGQIRRQHDASTGDMTLEVKETTCARTPETSSSQPVKESSHPRPRLDVPKVRQWLKTCEQDHSGLCKSFWPGERHKKPIDLILIDVWDLKLVKATSAERYIAMSYVWGKVTTLLTKLSNFEALLCPGALSRTDMQIARVIRDAMTLVSDMGERYLWADTLCIVQDDPVGKMDAIGNMDIIYGHALMTIIAASGLSAADSLPGVAEERPLMTLNHTIEGIPLVWRGAELSDNLRYSQYETRGWTLQEKLISRRCLYLGRDQAFFLCSSSYECEDYHDKEYWEKNEDHGQPLPIPQHPLYILYECMSTKPLEGVYSWSYCKYVYDKLVSDYSQRQLSHEADAVDAFQGIMGIMSEASAGDFILGLPEDILDLALLWVPLSRPLQRRKDQSLPSWSWVGWKGDLHYYELTPVHVQGIVREGEVLPHNGGKSDGRGDLVKRLSREQLYACRYYEFKFQSAIPQFALEHEGGWKTITPKGAGSLYGSIIEDVLGKDIAALTRASTLPVSWAVGDSAHPPLLHFVTNAIAATNFAIVDPQVALQYPGQINLYFRGVLCGMLFGDYHSFGGLGPSGSCRREFILMSKMPLSINSSYKNSFDERLGASGWFMCNVLLIEWDATRPWAERVAAGVIHSQVWHMQQFKAQHITLG